MINRRGGAVQHSIHIAQSPAVSIVGGINDRLRHAAKDILAVRPRLDCPGESGTQTIPTVTAAAYP